MNPLSVLRDSLHFFRNHLYAIATLCLPLVALESVCRLLIVERVPDDAAQVATVLVGLLFYPLYTGALILYLDARTEGRHPRQRDLLALAMRLWPSFAVLAAMCTLLIMLGLSLFILPGLWAMCRLALAEYLLVLEGMTPMGALRESFRRSGGRAFWIIFMCLAGVMIPLWLLEAISQQIYPSQANPVLVWLIDSANGFLQLFTSVVMFRLYMLLDAGNART